MKKIFAAFLFSLVASSFASASQQSEYVADEHYCVQTHPDSKRPLSFVLTQEVAGPMEEGIPEAYILRLYSGDATRPFLTKRVFAVSEDVLFGFSTKDKSVSGTIYLDELDQTSLNLGRNSYRFDCNRE